MERYEGVERQRMREPPLVSGALGRAHSLDDRSFSEAAPCHNGLRRLGTRARVAIRPESIGNARPFPRENKRIETGDTLSQWAISGFDRSAISQNRQTGSFRFAERWEAAGKSVLPGKCQGQK
jgi:hypothetical protein